jgi:hypothetical protein
MFIKYRTERGQADEISDVKEKTKSSHYLGNVFIL